MVLKPQITERALVEVLPEKLWVESLPNSEALERYPAFVVANHLTFEIPATIFEARSFSFYDAEIGGKLLMSHTLEGGSASAGQTVNINLLVGI